MLTCMHVCACVRASSTCTFYLNNDSHSYSDKRTMWSKHTLCGQQHHVALLVVIGQGLIAHRAFGISECSQGHLNWLHFLH